MHGVLRCTRCNRKFDRDVAAALNMGAKLLRDLFPFPAALEAPGLQIFDPPTG
jgi:transposase